MPVSILKVIPENEVINNEIEDGNGQVLGKISSILLDVDEARITYAILASKGFLGMDKSYYPIPWTALSASPRRHTYKLSVDADFLKNAPHFDNDHLPDFSSIEWNQDIHAYYKLPPYWQPEEQQKGAATAPASMQPSPPLNNPPAPEIQQEGASGNYNQALP